ncbi:cilia- and flagella-associated protein 57 [Anopheles ziemanni]|uniref:cilia- and flagella-associated protein 57 n=1 Tax=Anopheles coustani TaxID=139045 RepID=UPI00265A02E0|nr:cilia- and flagella-associated protein 57 [Anopheles coustani]XP_058177122.1 cilia- and flagella-associated protein 57 [Anopheles ziemanni]
MEKTNRSKQISIVPKNAYGLRTDILGNVHFTLKQEIIYPVAGVLAIHDYTTNKQKFLRFPQNCHPERIVISPNRKFIAVAERTNDNKSMVNIYEIETLRKRKTLQLPPDCPNTQIGNICFTHDSRGVAVLSVEPDAFLSIFSFDKNDSLIIGRASNSSQQGQAIYLSCNPNDATIVAVGGFYMLKIMNRTDKGFGQIGTIKGDDLLITSMTWLSSEVLAAGTAETEIIFVESGELKIKQRADEIETVDLSGEGDPNLVTTPAEVAGLKHDHHDVLCLTQFEKGFLYAIHNVVHVFERETNYNFRKKSIIRIPITLYEEQLYKIENVAVNHEQDTIVVATKHSQLYIGMLIVPETLKISELVFQHLGEPLHISGIIGMAVCSWKPIVMTASRDLTIRVWNYETMKVELVKKYQIEIGVIALHPSGFFAAVGFIDLLRLLQIQLDDLKETKSFNLANCTQLQFSNQGHLLAAAHGKSITLICIFTFEIVQTLRGHNGAILSLSWSTDDAILASGGNDGAIYKWNVVTGERLEEVVQKGIHYRSLALTADAHSVYSITNTGLIREVAKSDIAREFKIPELTPLTDMALARSDAILFVGSVKGHLYNVQVPLVDTSSGNCTNFRFFNTKVTKICITYDDCTLITAADDGTLIVWHILNNEGKTARHAPELGRCSDVLIARQELIEKNDSISTLEMRIQQQSMEFQYKMKQGDAFHSEQMRDIHKDYCAAIENLKKKNIEMEQAHTEEFNLITASIAQAKEEHQKEMMDFEAQFHEKIILEYDKLSSMKSKMDSMREEYEVKLRRSAGCLQDTIESMEADQKKMLSEKQEIIDNMLKDMDRKRAEFDEYCRQVDVDNDRHKVELQLQYEKKLQEEEENSIKWRGEAGVLKKKFSTLSREAEAYRKEIETMQAQHGKFQQSIRQHQRDIEALRREVAERDGTVRDRDRKLFELGKKTAELDKYKQVLSMKITELRAQIEPKDREIKERKEFILEMEKKLDELQQHNKQYELQLQELRDKYYGIDLELRRERNKFRNAKAQYQRVCGEIYNVSGLIQRPEELKRCVKELCHRYGDDKELQKSLALDEDVQNEFLRQREYLERMTKSAKQKAIGQRKDAGESLKLMKENMELLAELNKLRELLNEKQRACTRMEALLGLSSKAISPREAKEKLEKAVADRDAIEQQHREQVAKLEELIRTLSSENQTLRAELVAQNTRPKLPPAAAGAGGK